MSTKESAEQACKEPNPIIDGRKANVNLAILGAKPRGNSIQGEFIFTNVMIMNEFIFSCPGLPLATLQRFPLIAGQFG